PPGMEVNRGDNITVSLSGDDAAELRGYWEKLSAAGKVTMPLEKQMWGDEFGMCVDQFGVPWMVNISQPQG
ncbi:MAG TPA: VOC family protein, partial [Actinophytocola sp.]|nr:VOC family protein [Actinophytocola sp.]